jgi:hypothetical protein
LYFSAQVDHGLALMVEQLVMVFLVGERKY